MRKNFLLEGKSETLDIKEFVGCSTVKNKTCCGGNSDKNNGVGTWIKLNVDQAGFYRVKYDEDLTARLRCAIENKPLSATDRFGKFDFLVSLAPIVDGRIVQIYIMDSINRHLG